MTLHLETFSNLNTQQKGQINKMSSKKRQNNLLAEIEF